MSEKSSKFGVFGNLWLGANVSRIGNDAGDFRTGRKFGTVPVNEASSGECRITTGVIRGMSAKCVVDER
jgi:hypothetical protein